MVPIGVFVAVSVGELAGRIGAGGYSGAVVAFIIVGQASALVCADDAGVGRLGDLHGSGLTEDP